MGENKRTLLGCGNPVSSEFSIIVSLIIKNQLHRDGMKKNWMLQKLPTPNTFSSLWAAVCRSQNRKVAEGVLDQCTPETTNWFTLLAY